MRRKTIISSVLAAGLVLGGVSGAFAASAGYSGEVSSGGTIKYFLNERHSTQLVSNYLATGNGGVTQGLYSCSSYSGIGVADKNFVAGGSGTYNEKSRNTCFRVKMSRTNPADTNGALPGTGITTVSGTIYY